MHWNYILLLPFIDKCVCHEMNIAQLHCDDFPHGMHVIGHQDIMFIIMIAYDKRQYTMHFNCNNISTLHWQIHVFIMKWSVQWLETFSQGFLLWYNTNKFLIITIAYVKQQCHVHCNNNSLYFAQTNDEMAIAQLHWIDWKDIFTWYLHVV